MNRRWNEFQILSEMEAFQKKVKDKHPRLKNRVVGRGGQANTAPYSKKPSLKRGKSAPPIVNMVGEALEEEIDDSVLDSFKIKSVLAPMLWDRQILKDEIRQKLIDIAKDFASDWPIKLGIKDILLTGSIANYNWSEFSDIDLHILVDYSSKRYDKALISDYFHEAIAVWNNEHDIMIKNHEVEVYVQDMKEKHFSTGVYSLIQNKWLYKPDKLVPPLDTTKIQQKAEMQQSKIDSVEIKIAEEEYEAAHEAASNIKLKISRLRKTGLSDEGQYSTENLVFKVLRRAGELDRLSDLKAKAYDEMMGIK